MVQTAPARCCERAAENLNAKLRGHYQYYGRRTHYRAIRQFYQRVRCIWREWLSRRTRGKQLTWERFAEILRQYFVYLAVGGSEWLRLAHASHIRNPPRNALALLPSRQSSPARLPRGVCFSF